MQSRIEKLGTPKYAPRVGELIVDDEIKSLGGIASAILVSCAVSVGADRVALFGETYSIEEVDLGTRVLKKIIDEEELKFNIESLPSDFEEVMVKIREINAKKIGLK